MSPQTSSTDDFPPAEVTIEHGGRRWMRSIGPRGEYAVGRLKACELRLATDTAVSRRHATLFAHAGCLRIVRAPDARPVFVNGEAVTERFLAEGDIVRLGDTTLYIHYPPLSGDPTTDPKGRPVFRRQRAASADRTAVERAVLALRDRHGESFRRLDRTGLDEELGELLGVTASRARRRLDAVVEDRGLQSSGRGTKRYVAVVEALEGARTGHGR